MINWNPEETTTEDLIATIARANPDGPDFAAARVEMNRRCGEGSWRKYAPVRITGCTTHAHCYGRFPGCTPATR